MIARHVFVANRAPLFERRLREGDRVVNVRPNDIPPDIIIGAMTVGLELSEPCDHVGKGDRGWITFVFGLESRILHFLVIEHPRKTCPLILDLPVPDKVFYQQMKDSIICSRDGSAHTRFPILRVAFGRQISRVLEQVIGEHLGPSGLLQRRLLGNIPEIMIGSNTHAREVEPSSEAPHDFGRYLPKTLPCSVIGKNNLEENRPLPAPILADFIPDSYYVRRELSGYLLNRRLDLRLFRHCGGKCHSKLRLAQNVLQITAPAPAAPQH
jgi:hypothetical protein